MPTKRQPRTKQTKTYKRKRKQVVKSLAHGRPGEYNKKAHDVLALDFMLLGLTEEELAQRFGIAHLTLIEWKQKYPSFAKAIKDGGEEADAAVARSLYERAKGYDYNESTIRTDKNGVTRTVSKKSLPADIRAAEIWLRNRTHARKRWTKTVEDEEPPPPAAAPQITINNQVIDVSKLSDGAIRELIASVKPGEPQSGQAQS